MKYLYAVTGILVLGLLAWLGISLNSGSKQLAAMGIRLSVATEQVDALSKRILILEKKAEPSGYVDKSPNSHMPFRDISKDNQDIKKSTSKTIARISPEEIRKFNEQYKQMQSVMNTIETAFGLPVNELSDSNGKMGDFVANMNEYKTILDNLRQKRKKELKKIQDQESPDPDFISRTEFDKASYGTEAVEEATILYASLGEGDFEANWKMLYEKYPDSNIAGCGAVRVAQHYIEKQDFQKAEEFLNLASSNYSDSVFKDGTVVGPLADYNKAVLYARTNRMDQAREIMYRIKAEQPYASDGNDGYLSDRINDFFEKHE